jgi:hypothetical protein
MTCFTHMILHHFMPGFVRLTHSSVHAMTGTMLHLGYCRARQNQRCTYRNDIQESLHQYSPP